MSKFLWGVLIGGLMGGLAVLALAPRTGEEWRSEIVDQYRHVSRGTLGLVETVCARSRTMLDMAKELADEAKEATTKYLNYKE